MGEQNRWQVLDVDKRHFDRNVYALFFLVLITALSFLAISMQEQNPLWLELFLSFYIIITTARFLLHSVGHALAPREVALNSDFGSHHPLVSVIIPAFNEAQQIATVLRSFEKWAYLNIELIVVDDGSVDETAQIVAATLPTLSVPGRCLRQINGGKASALNHGLSHAQGDFILCVDADSVVQLAQLPKLLGRFSRESDLAAIAGQVKILKPNSLLSRFQHLDYLLGHYQRKILSWLGIVPIIPGPIGLFRKQAVLAVGGYEKDNKTFAEDAELTLRLVASGWRVVGTDLISASTEGPQTWQQLIRQRYRWSRGLYQAIFKNFRPLQTSTQNRHLFLLLYLIWEQILIPIFDFALLFLMVQYFVFAQDFQILLGALCVLFVLDAVSALFASQKESAPFSWFALSLLSRLTYTNLLLCWKILAIFEEIKNKEMRWDKLDRQGAVVWNQEAVS